MKNCGLQMLSTGLTFTPTGVHPDLNLIFYLKIQTLYLLNIVYRNYTGLVQGELTLTHDKWYACKALF